MTTITPDPQIARVLDDAADHLKAYGLIDGDYWEGFRHSIDEGDDWEYDGSASCCTVGAIAVAAGHLTPPDLDEYVAGEGTRPPHPAIVALADWLGLVDVSDIYTWSDELAHEDAAAKVIEQLRQCAAAYRGEVA